MVVIDAEPAADRSAVIPRRPGKPQPRAETPLRRIFKQRPYRQAAVRMASQGSRVPILLAGERHKLVAHPQVERQRWGHLPVVLKEEPNVDVPDVEIVDRPMRLSQHDRSLRQSNRKVV